MDWRASGLLKTNAGSQRWEQTGAAAPYLAGYVWRYNHRDLEVKDKIKCILALLENRYKLGG